MKKILSLVLVLAMMLSTAVALAEGNPSITEEDIQHAETDNKDIGVIVGAADNQKTADLKEALTANGANGVLDYIKKSISTGTNDNAVRSIGQGAGDNIVISEMSASTIDEVFEEYSSIDEITTMRIDVEGEVPKEVDELRVTYTFTKTYDEDEKVYLLIGIPGEKEDEVEWIFVEGKGDKDGNVVVVFDKDLLDKVGTKQFTVVVVSKEKK